MGDYKNFNVQHMLSVLSMRYDVLLSLAQDFQHTRRFVRPPEGPRQQMAKRQSRPAAAKMLRRPLPRGTTEGSVHT